MCYGLEYLFPLFRFSIKTFPFPLFFVPKNEFFCAMTASLSCVLDKFIYLAGMLTFHGINLSEQAALIM